jgi:16S rRNA (cytosine967-C5)-methyltransferase
VTQAGRIEAAIALLAAIAAAGTRPADAVANDFFRQRRYIGSGDRRAVSARVWQVLRASRRLRWWLKSDGTPRSLVAASLLLEGWSWSGVAQTFSAGQHGPAPLTAGETALLRPLEGHTLDHPDMPLAVRLEVPEWIVPSLRQAFGDRLLIEARALLEGAPLDLRVNLLKATREAARAALAAEGVATELTPLSPWGLRAAGRLPVTSGPCFQAGLVEIQDEGSQLVALMADVRPGMRVMDYCAGAGGKTLAMAMLMENRGHIIACDVSARRLEGATRRLRRAGVHNVEKHVTAAGDRFAKRRAAGFDRVLVDAPCTGTGTWRRNPDARLRLAPADLAALVVKQAAILDETAGLVRPGGRLIYATCSVLPEENEDQMQAFLTRHPGFSLVPPARIWPAVPSGEAAMLRLSPARDGTDGFFCAVLQRAEAA